MNCYLFQYCFIPRKYTDIEFKRRIRLIKKAGIEKIQKNEDDNDEKIISLDDRVKKILNLKDKLEKDKTKMLFFVMYDIESNKVRREIAKYLEGKGCVRIQKSIFFASAKHEVFSEIHKTIREVQEFYDNHDSIILVPISTDEVRSMKVIGQNIDFDIIMNNRNTLFF